MLDVQVALTCCGIEIALYKEKARGPSRNQSIRTKHALRKKCPMTAPVSDPIKIVFAIVLPPLGVFCAVGLRGQFWLNLAFTMLGYVPGIVHAIYVVLGPDPEQHPWYTFRP